jgi:hypothetical protein
MPMRMTYAYANIWRQERDTICWLPAVAYLVLSAILDLTAIEILVLSSWITCEPNFHYAIVFEILGEKGKGGSGYRGSEASV